MERSLRGLYIRLLIGTVLSLISIRDIAQDIGTTGLIYYGESLDKRLPFQKNISSGLKALNLFKTSKNDSLLLLSEIQLGILYWHDGNMDSSWRHLSDGQKLAESRKENFKLAQCQHYKGLVNYYLGNYIQALTWYDSAEQIFETIKADSALAKVKSHKGIIYSITGQYQRAIQNVLESFKLQESFPGYRDETLSMQFSSSTDEQLYYKSKLERDLESLNFLEKTNDKIKMAFTLHNLGSGNLHLNNLKEALSYFKRSSAIYISLGYPSFLADVADVYVAMKKYDSAVYFYQKWIKETKERGTQTHLVAAYSKLAHSYYLQGDLRNALSYLEAANYLNGKMGLRQSMSVLHDEKAKIFLKLNRPHEAIREVDESLIIAQQLGCIKDMQEFLETKSEVLQKLNRYKESAEALALSLLLKDSIHEGETKLQVARLQIEYKTEKKNREVAELQTQNKLKETAIETRNLQIALALALVAIIATAGGFNYYRYRQNRKSSTLLAEQNQLIEKQNQELQLQNKEKEVLLSEVHHRVKNNLQIISSLINIKVNQASTETLQTLQQVNGHIFSMGLVHEKLYQKESMQLLRLNLYLKELVQYLIESFTENEHPVTLEMDAESIELDANKTLACGLICNEIITNSFKHAFTSDQQSRKIKIKLNQNNGIITLLICDNGERGNLAQEMHVNSFGLRFVDQLVTSKLAGTWNIKSESGTKIEIIFS